MGNLRRGDALFVFEGADGGQHSNYRHPVGG